MVLPSDGATPLGLRSRFKEHQSLEFTSEVLRQLQIHLDSRDDRGRPLLLRDARLLADTARTVIAATASSARQDLSGSRFCESAALRPLIAAGSRRLLRHAVTTFDLTQPERFLPLDSIDERLHAECQALLEESLGQPEFAAVLAALVDVDQVVARTIERASTDLLQCGCDRRTLIVTPRLPAYGPAVERLAAARPLAASVTTTVNDVLVVSEDAGISPRSLAGRLEQVFPGIADAARRLVTRIDIAWDSLR